MSDFSVATWNVNSLKVRLPHLREFLAAEPVDALVLQEIKMEDKDFPGTELAALGYQSVSFGQKTYNGVALLARGPITDVVRGIPGYEDPQSRVIAGTVSGIRIVGVYVPNGQAVGSDKYAYKLHWLEALAGYMARLTAEHARVVVLGDYNIAPDDRDVHDPQAWAGQVHVSEPERAALQGLQALGYADAFRLKNDAPGQYSWWDYRAGGFRRNHGLRIDLVLASEALGRALKDCRIEREPRTWERPSDHAPVIATFSLADEGTPAS